MKRWALPLACLVLALLAGLWFVMSHEKRTTTERLPPKAEAQRDPFLAAQRLLQALDMPTRQLQTLTVDSTWPTRAALVLPAPRGGLGPAAIERLAAFVHEGGHLLVESELLPLRDPLLARFGIGRRVFEDGEDGFGWSRHSWNWREPTRSGAPDAAFLVPVDADRPELAIHLRAPHALEVESGSGIRWTQGYGLPAIVQVEHGQGRVTAVNSLTPWQNWEIGRYDHAEFLHWLLLDSGVEEVVFVRPWHGGLLRWLGQHHWRSLLLGALLLACLLWALLPRFGPLQPEPELARRRLLDHLAASGRLLWSCGEREALARAAVQGALRRVRTEYPHVAGMDPASLALFLVRRFGLDAQQANLLVRPRLPTELLPFLALMRACRRVHQALARAAGPHASDPLYES